MTDLDKMERAMQYLDKLADGENPFTGKELPNDTILNDVRISRCFVCAAKTLRNVIELSKMPQSKAKNAKKEPFTLTPEQKASFHISETPLRVGQIVDKLNDSIDTNLIKKISSTMITDWLLSKGFLQKIISDTGKPKRHPTEAGNSIGLSLKNQITEHGVFPVVYYNSAAQEFILDHLDAIVSESKK